MRDAPAVAPPPDGDLDARHRPGWIRLAWFLGTPPALTRHQWRVLGLVSLVSLFEQYDVYLFALNLPLIQRELGIDERHLGLLGGIVNSGAWLAVLVSLAADRVGRRRVLLFAVAAYTILTGATAFAPSTAAFAAIQFGARIFATAQALLAVVVVTEELDAEHRGWGLGALGAFAALGAGLAALLFGFVGRLPYGWRALYLVGLAPLAGIPWWRRSIPETRRFASRGRARGSLFAPMVELLREYPVRIAALAGAAFLLWLAWVPATFFAPKYLLDVQHWTAPWIATLNLVGGAIAIIGNAVAGALSDRFGRRPVTAVFMAGFALATMAFYASSGPAVAPLWVVMIFSSMGANVTVGAFGAEMFPTSARATASGVRAAANTIGGVVGLAMVSGLYAAVGSNWRAIIVLAAIMLGAPLLVLTRFPETAGRPLEQLAREGKGRPRA